MVGAYRRIRKELPSVLFLVFLSLVNPTTSSPAFAANDRDCPYGAWSVLGWCIQGTGDSDIVRSQVSVAAVRG